MSEKTEKKDETTNLSELECVKGFMQVFLQPANNCCAQMQEIKRYGFKAIFVDADNGAYYKAQILFNGKEIMSEQVPVALGQEKDHEKSMDQVVHLLLINLVVSGLFTAKGATEELENASESKNGLSSQGDTIKEVTNNKAFDSNGPQTLKKDKRVQITDCTLDDYVGLSGILCEDWETYFKLISPPSELNERPEHACFAVIGKDFNICDSPEVKIDVEFI